MMLAEVPRWKKWLSYLFELHVESAPSMHNPHLYVSLRRGRYQLSTAHAIYSYEDLYTNFLYAFRQIRFERLPGENVLLLGLGLGSVPLMLEQVFRQPFRYTAVELDPNVIYLANKYTLSGLASPVTTLAADAHAFMMQQKERYSLICMDIFLDDVIPAAFQQTSFLRALREALLPGGVLMYNCLYRNEEDKVATERFYREYFLRVFPEGAYLDVDGNWMLVSDKSVLSIKKG
jgi:spermidine synthase